MFKSLPLWITLPLRYGIGCLIVFWLLKNQTLDWKHIATLPSSYVFLGIFLVSFQLLLSALRVKIFLRDQGISTSLSHCVQFNSIGIFYSTFLPGGISGDIARAYFFWKKYPQASKTSLAGALFLDRFFGLVMMIFIGLIAATFILSFDETFKKFVIFGWILLITGLIFFIVLSRQIVFDESATNNTFWQKIIFNLRKFISKINLGNYSKSTIVKVALLSIGIHFAAIFMIYVFSIYVSSGLTVIQVAAVSPIGLLINALPISPGGIGVGEKSFDVLFQMLGGSDGGNAFLITRIFMFSPALIGGIFVFISFLKAHKYVK